jgi:hypothetical protein
VVKFVSCGEIKVFPKVPTFDLLPLSPGIRLGGRLIKKIGPK